MFGLKLIATLLFLNSSVAFAAIDADTLWEVRTTGNSNNGCGADQSLLGTDYTQQDSAQLSLTDLATSGTTVTTLTSATGGFTSAMVGNAIYIHTGTNVTAGYYIITAHTDTNTVTLDRAPDDGGGGVASGEGSVGGACVHPQDVASSLVAGNKIYIQDGEYLRQGSNAYVLNTSVAGGSQDRIMWIGYDTTRGDSPRGSDRPNFNANSAAADGIVADESNNYFFNIIVENATDDGIDGGSGFFWNVRSTNNGGYGVEDDAAGFYFGEIDNNTSHGLDCTGSCSVNYTYFHDNGGTGFYGSDANSSQSGTYNILDTNSGNGTFWSWGSTHGTSGNHHFSIAYNNTLDGFYCGGGSNTSCTFIGNSSSSNGDEGFVVGGGNSRIFEYNNYYDNVTEVTGITYISDTNTGDDNPDYTDPANGDFTVQSGSPLLGSSGFMIDWGDQGLTGTGYNRVIGATGNDPDAGGGGGSGPSAYTFVQ